MTDEPRCDTCRGWKEIESDDSPPRVGECRRRGPVNRSGQWPLTYDHDWCLDHTPKQTRARTDAKRFPDTREEDLS